MWEYNYDYLCHHGIIGQKWGVRRFQNADGSLTAAGRDRYSVNGSKSASKPQTNNADNTKGNAYLAYVAVMYLAPMAFVGGVAGIDAIKRKALKSKIKKERAEAEVDPKTGLRIKKDTGMSEKDDMKRVNPDFLENKESQHNCMLCTTAYDMRRRGYEVQARKVFEGFTTDTVKQWYPKAKINKVSGKDEDGDDSTKALIANTKKALLEQGDGARGNLMNSWTHGGGHSIVYEIKNNKIILRDCQTNSTLNIDSFVEASKEIEFVRLDNVDFDPKKIKEAVK